MALPKDPIALDPHWESIMKEQINRAVLPQAAWRDLHTTSSQNEPARRYDDYAWEEEQMRAKFKEQQREEEDLMQNPDPAYTDQDMLDYCIDQVDELKSTVIKLKATIKAMGEETAKLAQEFERRMAEQKRQFEELQQYVQSLNPGYGRF
jgi:predicted RNase H-like nuclease (RuvC/YqgF family)